MSSFWRALNLSLFFRVFVFFAASTAALCCEKNLQSQQPYQPDFRISFVNTDDRINVFLDQSSQELRAELFIAGSKYEMPLWYFDGSFRASFQTEAFGYLDIIYCPSKEIFYLRFPKQKSTAAQFIVYRPQTRSPKFQEPNRNRDFQKFRNYFQTIRKKQASESIQDYIDDEELSPNKRNALAFLLQLEVKSKKDLVQFVEILRETDSEDILAQEIVLSYLLWSAPISEVSINTDNNFRENIQMTADAFPSFSVLRTALSWFSALKNEEGKHFYQEGYLLYYAGIRAQIRALHNPAASENERILFFLYAFDEAYQYALSHDWLFHNFKKLPQVFLRHIKDKFPAHSPLRKAITIENESNLALDSFTLQALKIGRLKIFLEQEGEGLPNPPPFKVLKQMPNLPPAFIFHGVQVKRFEGDFFNQAASWRQMAQGCVGNCYFLAALGAMALARPEDMAKIEIKETALGPDDPEEELTSYELKLAGHSKSHVIYPYFYTDSKGRLLFASDRHLQQEQQSQRFLFAPLLEKLFAKTRAPEHSSPMFQNSRSSYQIMDKGNSEEVFELIYLQSEEKVFDYFHPNRLTETELALLLQHLIAHSIPTTANTHSELSLYKGKLLYHNHVYVIHSIKKTNNTYSIRLINLHRDSGLPAPEHQSNVWKNIKANLEPSKDFATYRQQSQKNGSFVISLKEFQELFSSVTHARLEGKVSAASLRRADLIDKSEIPLAKD